MVFGVDLDLLRTRGHPQLALAGVCDAVAAAHRGKDLRAGVLAPAVPLLGEFVHEALRAEGTVHQLAGLWIRSKKKYY